jgi:ribosome modulation factor
MAHIKDQGYRAQAQGRPMTDNPYPTGTQSYWAWRAGYLEAFKDSN